MMPTIAMLPDTVAKPIPDTREKALREQAVQLESFLFEELLRVSGTGTPSPGGGGETQFDSFLRRAQAEAVASSWQTGLAESIFRSLAKSAASEE